MAFQHQAHSKPLALQGNFQGRLPAFAAQAKAAFPQAAQRQRTPHVQAALGQHAPKHYAAQQRSASQPQTAQPSRIGNAFRVPPTVNLAGTGQGRPLPEAVRQKMESFFNTDFSDVRIHTGVQAQQIGAVAFTLGSDLHFAPGQYNPNTSHGQRLLGHELTHVMQQRAGRVRNPFGAGVAVVQDPGMEAEADRMGIQAAAHRVPILQPKLVSSGRRQPARQIQPLLSGTIQAAFTPAGIAARNRVNAITGGANNFDPFGGFTFVQWHPHGGRIGFDAPIVAHVVANAPHDNLGPPNWYTCPYCLWEYPLGRMQVDHEIPWAAYSAQMTNAANIGAARAWEVYVGCNDPANLTLACQPCNGSKGNNAPTAVWIAARRALANAQGGF